MSFQSKATAVTAAQLKAETWTPASRPKKGGQKTSVLPPKLRPVINWVLANGGAYIVVTTEPFTERQKKPLIQAIEDGISATGNDPTSIIIELYDANKIADWASNHQAAALWVNEHIGGQSLSGFKSLTTWGRLQDFLTVPWADDDAPRIKISPLILPRAEQKVAARNSWTFSQARNAIRDHISTPGRAVRIVGPSGIGKSRFAHALVRPSDDATDSIHAASAIYADFTMVGSDALRLAQRYADESLDALLIVDECPDPEHHKLVECATQQKSRLRLITIDVTTNVLASPTVLVVEVETADHSLIDAIVEGTAPTLSPAVKHWVREIAQGFPRLAVHGIRAAREGANPIRNAEELVDRIVWGRGTPDPDAMRALEVVSLFDAVRISGENPTDLSIIALPLAETTETRFREHLLQFIDRGIVIEKGRYAQVLPIPLAAHLGERRLKALRAQGVKEFFDAAPGHLQSRLLDRLKWLDASREAQEFALALLAAENLGSVALLNTDFGSRCFDRLVHVVPDAAMSTLDATIGALSIDDLKGFGPGRRHIVWALEKLVFRKNTFERAARILFNLAIAETEANISNNASGIFKGLFHLRLSGTEAPPDARLRVLDDALNSPRAEVRRFAVEIAGVMLKTNHFMRMSDAEAQGSEPPLEEWTPTLWRDVWDFHREGLRRLEAVAVSDDPNASLAQNIIGLNLRGLLSALPLEDITATARRIAAHIGVWQEGIRATNHWLYFDRHDDARKDATKQVEALYSELMPDDPVDCLLLFASCWPMDLYNPEHNYSPDDRGSIDFEYINRQISSLVSTLVDDETQLKRLLDDGVGATLHSGFVLGKALTEIYKNHETLFDQALKRLESKSAAGDLRFLKGLISGIETRDREAARRCVDKALHLPILQERAIEILQGLMLSAADLPRIIEQLHVGHIDPARCAHISYGCGLDALSADDLATFLDELILHGADGCWSALKITSMYLHSRVDLPAQLSERLIRILTMEGLLLAAKPPSSDGFLFKSEIERLLRHDQVDGDLAAALTRQLLSILDLDRSSRFDFEHCSDELLSALIAAQPKAVWQEFAPRLEERNPLKKWLLERLLKPGRDDHSGAGVLFKLPEALYLEWVRQSPEQRAPLVAQWVPMTEKLSDEKRAWSPVLERFIEEFGSIDGVLPAIGSRLYPSSWWGSLVPHLEPWLPLLDSWRNHQLQSVRHWAQAKHQRLRDSIERERCNDQEDDLL